MIWAAFSELFQQRSHAPAIQNDEGTLSYAGLSQRVETASETIENTRVSGSRRVLLAETEPLDLLVSVLACWSKRLVPVISREGRSSQGLSDIHDLLVSVSAAESSATQDGINTKISGDRFVPQDEALVICTSGTTSSAKLVALSAESVLINIRTIATQLSLQSDDLIAVTTPLTYMYGLFGGTLSGLWAGATVRFFPITAPQTVVQAAIRKETITVVQGPPSLWRIFLAYWNGRPFPGVRLVTTGGELIDGGLVDQMEAAFPEAACALLYGMTEAGPRISHRIINDESNDYDVLGMPFKHIDWYIAPIDQNDLPEGTGRLVFRGPSVFLGYITGDGGYVGLDDDGYFHSNDLVRLNTQGRMQFVDRFDRMFKCGGKLVSPNEVEATLLRHPAIKEAICRKEPHELFGFMPVAEIVPHDSASVTAPEIKAFCAGFLQPHSIPRRFDFRSAISLASSGKRQL